MPAFDTSYRATETEIESTTVVPPKFPSSNPPPAEPTKLKAQMRKLSQQNLRLQSQTFFFANILESSSDAMVVADHVGKILIFNAAASKLLQIEVDEALGNNLFRLLGQVMPVDDATRPFEMLKANQSVKNFRTEISGLENRIPVPVLLTLNYVQGSDTPAIVAVIKDNSEVEALMRMDELTGIANRREFDRRLTEDCLRLNRGLVSEVSLLFMDVDLFKKFNTDFGHQGGDAVLTAVGQVLRECVREIDTPARYGGEEFVVILPGTDSDGALLVAERIRKTLSQTKVRLPKHGNVSVTVSVGVSTGRRKSMPPEQLVSEANEAMRAAKDGGRNQTKRYSQRP